MSNAVVPVFALGRLFE